jgi:hypothetical protein
MKVLHKILQVLYNFVKSYVVYSLINIIVNIGIYELCITNV